MLVPSVIYNIMYVYYTIYIIYNIYIMKYIFCIYITKVSKTEEFAGKVLTRCNISGHEATYDTEHTYTHLHDTRDV